MKQHTVGSLLGAAARRWPGMPGLVDPGGGSWTFAELLADARRVAAALLALVEPGERVAVWAPNCPEWFLLQLGAGLAGVTVVTVNPGFSAAEAADVLGRSRSAAVLVADEHRGRSLPEVLAAVRPSLPELRTVIPLSSWAEFLGAGSDRALPQVRMEDPAQIQYTSGTTGTPKGAVLSHGAITANGAAGARRWAVRPGAVWLNAMPMFHVAGSVINALGALAAGATQLICPFDSSMVGTLIERHRVDIACLAGSMWSMVLERGRGDLSTLRLAVAGGQSIPPDLVRRLEAAIGGEVAILFGMTELCGTVTAVAPGDDDRTRLNTCGRPLPGVRLRVVDPTTDTVLPPASVGEVQATGWLTMNGYLDDPAATAETLTADGWLRTGDVGSLDEAGRLRITGRTKEMIIRAGENIYPAEIESRLRAHPALADAAVVGVPDDLYGETVAAAVVLRPGARMPETVELAAWCRSTLAPFKVPVRWVELPALPMTPSGKTRKFQVRKTMLAAEPTATPV